MTDKNDFRAIVIIFLVLLVITLVSVLLYCATPAKMPVDNKSVFQSKSIDFTECLNDDSKIICKSKVLVNQNNIDINYKKMKTAMSNEQVVGASLYLNKTEILSPDLLAYRLESKVYLTDNKIIFAIYEATAKNIRLYIKTHSGFLLKEISEVDNEKDIIVTDFRVDGNKLIITGTKYIKGGSVTLTLEDDNRYIFKNSSICDEVLASANYLESELYQAEYEVVFSAKNRFSEIKIIPGTEIYLSEYLKALDCNN